MRHLAIAACVAVLGSTASAGHLHRHKHKHHKVAVAEPVDDDTVEVREPAPAPRHDWSFAIGPNAWASSVDAKVSLGGKMVSGGVDFLAMEEHVRFGLPLLAEARFGRWSIVGDLLLGVVDVDGAGTVGPLMVSVNGTASSLMFDGMAGYRVYGDEFSPVAVEARGGVRYQRTSIAGTIDIDGSPVTSLSEVSGGADMLAGARAFVRPTSRIALIGAADIGIAGSSQSTWSASADASVRVSPHFQFSLGWRTMTTEGALVTIVMHGPRVALQLLF